MILNLRDLVASIENDCAAAGCICGPLSKVVLVVDETGEVLPGLELVRVHVTHIKETGCPLAEGITHTVYDMPSDA